MSTEPNQDTGSPKAFAGDASQNTAYPPEPNQDLPAEQPYPDNSLPTDQPHPDNSLPTDQPHPDNTLPEPEPEPTPEPEEPGKEKTNQGRRSQGTGKPTTTPGVGNKK